MTGFIVLLSLSLSFLIGIIASFKMKNRSGFYVADRKLGVIATTASLTATGIGGSAAIAAVVYVYTRGLPGIWLNLAAGLGLILLSFTLARKVRQHNVYSLPELLGKLYGKKSRAVASILVLIAEIAWLALVIQGAQLILTTVITTNPNQTLLIATSIFVLYTILGGQFAVSYSDIFQWIIMFVGVLWLTFTIIFTQYEGFPLLKNLPKEVLSFPTGTKMGILDVVSLIFLMGLPHLVGPDIYSKILSAKNETVAKRASLFSGVLRMLWGVAIAVIALGAINLFPGLENPNTILPKMISFFFHPVVAGVVVAAFLAAMISSADTILLTGSTVLTNDILKIPGRVNEGLLLPRVSVLIIGFLGLMLALYLKDIIKTLQLAYTFFASGLIIPIIAGFYKDKLKVNEMGALASMLGGGIISLLLKLEVLKILPQIDPILMGMTISLTLLFAFSIRKKI